MPIPDFSKIHNLLTKVEQRYELTDENGHANDFFHAFQELYVLAQQIEYLLSKLSKYKWNTALGSKGRSQLYAETFYYKAFRMLRLLNKGLGLKIKYKNTSDSCFHITWVRNQLIEHSEQEGGIKPMSFGWREGKGAVIKPVGQEEGEEIGLYEDANALFDEVSEKLDLQCI